MRFFAPILVAAALLPNVAAAQEKTTSKAEVEFKDSIEFFRGDQFSVTFPQDSALAIQLVADVDADVVIDMLGESELEWPDMIMQTWNGIENGGEIEFTSDLTLEANAVLDGTSLGLPAFTFTVWDDTWTWESNLQQFDSLLLPGSETESVTVAVDETVLFDFFEDFDFEAFGETVVVGVGADVTPNVSCTVRGEKITTDAVEFLSETDKKQVSVPNSNLGTGNWQSRWEGLADAAFGFDITFTGSIGIAGGPSVNIPYTYSWLPFDDTRPAKTKPIEYTHDLPAINLGSVVVDFGDVTVGEVEEQDITVNNLGEIELKGEAVLTGDAMFDINQPDIAATKTGPDTITVSFEPTSAGAFTATIEVETNDPVNPTQTITLSGTGISTEGGDDTGIDGGAGTQQGCGCSSTTSGAPFGVLGLGMLGLLGMRRRE